MGTFSVVDVDMSCQLGKVDFGVGLSLSDGLLDFLNGVFFESLNQ